MQDMYIYIYIYTYNKSMGLNGSSNAYKIPYPFLRAPIDFRKCKTIAISSGGWGMMIPMMNEGARRRFSKMKEGVMS